jgi:hypothetical protein
MTHSPKTINLDVWANVYVHGKVQDIEVFDTKKRADERNDLHPSQHRRGAITLEQWMQTESGG